MKKLVKIFSLAIIGISSITSCDTELDLTGDYQQLPVVTGILNQADSIQYVKVTRTFLGPGDATQISLIPDSNYFQNIEITVTENIQGNSRTWTLRDTIIEDKEPGAFYTTPNKVYYFITDPNENHNINSLTSRLHQDANYRLDININNGAEIYYATTKLVKNAAIVSPSGNNGLGFNSFESGSQIAVVSKDVIVNVNPGTGDRISYEYYVEYDEHTASGFNRLTKTFNFSEVSVEQAGNVSQNLSGESMYSWLETVVPQDATVLKRSIYRAGVKVHIASEEFNQFIIASQPVSGLSQSKPSYTNIIHITTDEDGNQVELTDDAIGFFGSRTTIEYTRLNDPGQTWGRIFNKATLTGHYNLGLGFCSAHSVDNAENYFCP